MEYREDLPALGKLERDYFFGRIRRRFCHEGTERLFVDLAKALSQPSMVNEIEKKERLLHGYLPRQSVVFNFSYAASGGEFNPE